MTTKNNQNVSITHKLREGGKWLESPERRSVIRHSKQRGKGNEYKELLYLGKIEPYALNYIPWQLLTQIINHEVV